ncbi:MAG: signal peptidase I [Bacteroidales bacterium]|nr:signal peptidase I [Bacteroidales bacterium]
MPKRKTKKYKAWIKAFFIALIILWVLKSFFLEITVSKSDKMEFTIFRGDVILISKLTPGPRFPITLLSIPFFGNTLPFSSTPSYVDWIQLPYFRLNLFNIERNDLIAFNFPYENDPPIDKKRIEIKRCVGLPGDVISIHDKKVFINDQYLDDSPHCKYRYRITALEPLDSAFYTLYKINYAHLVAKPYIYDIITSRTIADSIANNPVIKRIQILKLLNLPKFVKIFPYSPYISWSFDYFGPLYIPKKGQTLPLTKENIYYFKDIIQKYEYNSLKIINDSTFIINDKPASTYTFRYNYYFVLDDNRDQAMDSRYWGFLPETHIIGKAKLILYNLENNNRLFKSVH